MELYRSIASLGRRASAKGALALYGDAISGVSAYSAAQAGNSNLSFYEAGCYCNICACDVMLGACIIFRRLGAGFRLVIAGRMYCLLGFGV